MHHVIMHHVIFFPFLFVSTYTYTLILHCFCLLATFLSLLLMFQHVLSVYSFLLSRIYIFWTIKDDQNW